MEEEEEETEEERTGEKVYIVWDCMKARRCWRRIKDVVEEMRSGGDEEDEDGGIVLSMPLWRHLCLCGLRRTSTLLQCLCSVDALEE